MSAQLVIRDTVIDLPEEVNFNFRVGDLAEISLSKSTYTSSFKIPRTSDIVMLFEGLGIPADRSPVPYRINDVVLMDDYTPLLKGVLVFMRTDDLYYHVSVISGSFDFFTEIGETRYSDIDISEIVHEKTLPVVVSHIEGLILYPYGGYFTYGFANFGGLSHYEEVDPDTEERGPVTVNIDYLIPAVTAKYLWDKIFETFPRFTFSGDFYESMDFERLWLTFPYDRFGKTGTPVLKMTPQKTNYMFSGTIVLPPLVFNTVFPIDFLQQDAGATRAECISPGLCRVVVEEFHATTSFPDDSTTLRLHVFKNGSDIILEADSNTIAMAGQGGTVDVYLEVGDFINFTVTYDPPVVNGTIHDMRVSLSRVSITESSLKKTYSLQLRSFVKEIMWRYGLLAFVENNHIEFVRIGSIINSLEVVDWSDKYMSRTEEEYTLDYNQNNWLRHKYDEEGADYFDKNIEVDNQNLKPSRDLIQSNFFAPLQDKIPYRTHPFRSIMADTFTTFEGPDDYKVLDRNFFARVKMENLPYRIGSGSMGGAVQEELDPMIQKLTHVIDFDNLSFSENTYYDALSKILDLTRVHRIELLLTPVDINQLSLKKIYYFEQEASYYMLNKLQYKMGDQAKGEFIKVHGNTEIILDEHILFSTESTGNFTFDIDGSITRIEARIGSTAIASTSDPSTTKELDLSGNTGIADIVVVLPFGQINSITSVSAIGQQIVSENVSDFPSLLEIDLRNNLLVSFDPPPSSQNINVDNNQIATMPIANNLSLVNLWAHNNMLTSFTPPETDTLERVEINDNPIEDTIDLSPAPKLRVFSASRVPLTGLKYDENTELEGLFLSNNTIPESDMQDGFDAISSLTNIELQSMPTLIDININNNVGIVYLWLRANPNLENVEWEDLVNVRWLNVNSNGSWDGDMNVSNMAIDREFWVTGTNITPAILDSCLIAIDNMALTPVSPGRIIYGDHDGVTGEITPTSTSLTAYNNLITRGWEIIGPVPGS